MHLYYEVDNITKVNLCRRKIHAFCNYINELLLFLETLQF